MTTATDEDEYMRSWIAQQISCHQLNNTNQEVGISDDNVMEVSISIDVTIEGQEEVNRIAAQQGVSVAILAEMRLKVGLENQLISLVELALAHIVPSRHIWALQTICDFIAKGCNTLGLHFVRSVASGRLDLHIEDDVVLQSGERAQLHGAARQSAPCGTSQCV